MINLSGDKFPAPRILKWNQITREKYFVTFKEGGHKLQCTLIKKLELNHQNRFVFLRLIDCKEGSECLRFPTKFIAFSKNANKRRLQTHENTTNPRPRKRQRIITITTQNEEEERDPMEI